MCRVQVSGGAYAHRTTLGSRPVGEYRDMLAISITEGVRIYDINLREVCISISADHDSAYVNYKRENFS